jgi:hypothetical protein
MTKEEFAKHTMKPGDLFTWSSSTSEVWLGEFDRYSKDLGETALVAHVILPVQAQGSEMGYFTIQFILQIWHL